MRLPASTAARPIVLLAVLVLLPLAAAFRWSWAGVNDGPRAVVLGLGPGDGPSVSGFTPEWEVDEKVGTHWTTYDATIVLPLEVRSPARVTLRYSRVLPQTAVVDVAIADLPAERFTCRGGAWEERTLSWVSAVPPAFSGADLPRLAQPVPARVSIRVDSHDRRNLGLKLDWIRLEAGGVRLAGWARGRPALAVALLAALFVALGWPLARAAVAAAPLALAVTALLVRDAWVTYRLLTGVPEMLAVALGLALALRSLPAFRGGYPSVSRLACTVAAYAFLVRAAAVNHPSFYYPDLLVHARLVEVVRGAGLDFLRTPSRYVWGDPDAASADGRGASGLWMKDIGGRAFGLPYSLAFHAPFAPFESTLDRRIGWLKVWGAALSVVPILALGALVRRWGLSTWALFAAVLVPTYTSRLAFALLPALWGHAIETLFVVWLARREAGRLSSRTIVSGTLFLAGCQLAYVSATASLLAIGLAGAAWLAGGADGRHRARAFGIMLVVASVLSVGLYYRDFLGFLLALGGPEGVRGAGSGTGFENPLARLVAVFGATFVAAAAAGGVLLWRSGAWRALVASWALVGALLLLARAFVPVMRFSHEELWIAPLVCLAAAESLGWLASRGRIGRVAAVAAGAALAIEGLWLQWQSLAAQLGNAR